MKKLSLWNKFSKYIHKSFQKWPFLVQVGSKAQQPPRSPIKGHFWRREYGPSNCTSRSQRKPSSENIPPRRQLQIPSHKSFDQRELRPSQNYVTPHCIIIKNFEHVWRVHKRDSANKLLGSARRSGFPFPIFIKQLRLKARHCTPPTIVLCCD